MYRACKSVVRFVFTGHVESAAVRHAKAAAAEARLLRAQLRTSYFSWRDREQELVDEILALRMEAEAARRVAGRAERDGLNGFNGQWWTRLDDGAAAPTLSRVFFGLHKVRGQAVGLDARAPESSLSRAVRKHFGGP